MSGMSDTTDCPNCGAECARYSDYKPYDMVSLECYECGLYTDTQIKQYDLEELNDLRAEAELAPLTELPKITFDY